MRFWNQPIILIKKSAVFLLFFALSLTAHAQFLEFGGGAGVWNYAGDLNRGYPTSNLNFGLTAFHRMNMSEIVGIKYALSVGKLSGSDENAFDALGDVRQMSFERRIVEASMVFEYNFLDFKSDHSRVRWTPYLFGGVGFVRLFGDREGDYNKTQPVVPFGIGFKQLIGKQFALGLEVGMRKTFFDELDNVSDGDIEFKDFQFGNPNDKDWYSYAGISISYIIYKIPCPFRYVPNGSIYR